MKPQNKRKLGTLKNESGEWIRKRPEKNEAKMFKCGQLTAPAACSLMYQDDTTNAQTTTPQLSRHEFCVHKTLCTFCMCALFYVREYNAALCNSSSSQWFPSSTKGGAAVPPLGKSVQKKYCSRQRALCTRQAAHATKINLNHWTHPVLTGRLSRTGYVWQCGYGHACSISSFHLVQKWNRSELASFGLILIGLNSAPG